jgi:hypothetical protein
MPPLVETLRSSNWAGYSGVRRLEGKARGEGW